jgi:hypothetical protein
MGEETGRKSPLRRTRIIVVLAVILAISLAPAITLRFYPRENLGHPLKSIESQTGISGQLAVAISLVTTFVVTIIVAPALLLVLAKEFLKSVSES